MTPLLEAQTRRLKVQKDVTSRFTDAAKPIPTKHAADGTQVYVRRNAGQSDILMTGTDKKGVSHAIRLTARSRGRGFKNLQLNCMATVTQGNKRLGRIMCSNWPASRMFGGLGFSASDRSLSVVFDLQTDAKIAISGVQNGLKLPSTVHDTLDPKHPNKSHLESWVSATLGDDLDASLRYFDPALTRAAAVYKKRHDQFAAASGLEASTLALSIALIMSHQEKLLSAKGDGGRLLSKELLGCGVGAVTGSLGGPVGAILGCAGGIVMAAGSTLIDEGYEPPLAPPPDQQQPGTGDTGGSGDDEGDDGWGGVCGDGPIGGEGAVDDSGGQAGGGCFIAGTPVATPSGPIPIEQLRDSSSVWARERGNAASAARAVERIVEHQSREVLELDFGNEVIRCTSPHPFFTGAWTKAGDLVPGMSVVRRDGTWQTLRAIERAARTEPVFDLTVSDLHTFYVGRNELLVHNKSPAEAPDQNDPWTPADDN